MLLSTEKKFIFIHIPKSAGTSVTRVLEPYSVLPKKTQYRRLLSHLPIPENPHKAWLRGHDKAWWLKMKLPRDMWDSYCKFAVVRNPYDYVVSYYFSVRKNPASSRHNAAMQQEFGEFLRAYGRKNWINGILQSSWVTGWRGRDIIVDRIVRYEDLDAGLAQLFADLGIENPPVVPVTNTSTHEHYRSYYTAEDRAYAAKLFARDIELFGYEF